MEQLSYMVKVRKIMKEVIVEEKSEEEILRASSEVEYYCPSAVYAQKATLRTWYTIWKRRQFARVR